MLRLGMKIVWKHLAGLACEIAARSVTNDVVLTIAIVNTCKILILCSVSHACD